MRVILLIIGILCAIAAVLGGLYVALYLCLFGGIIQLIQGVKATPIIPTDIALGIIRILLTSLAGWVTFFVGAGISSIFFAGAGTGHSRRYR